MRSLPVAASPQEQVYAQAYKDLTAHLSADEAFGRTRSAVESHLGLLGKQAQVRVRNWLKKLSEETANVVWKRNRNAYARLLLEQLRCGKLEEPFSAQPPGGPLPTLPKHLGYAFQPPRGGTGGAGTGGSPAAAGPQAGPPVAPVQSLQQQQALQHQALQQPHRQQQQVQALSASEQLDEYLGRADFRRAQHVEEEESAAAAAAAWVPNAAPLHTSSAAGGGAGPAPPLCLPGTRMQLRGAEGRRVDRHQLGDVGWQPSKLELEAALGASRERQAELEWRLGAMEGLLRQHTALLAPPAAPPLGSLLDAIDDGHVSPRRQRAGKKELEELIQRYEDKRQLWKAPAWAEAQLASAARGSGGSPSMRRAAPVVQPSDEVEILEQLDAFRRQTETIRRALAGSDGAVSWAGVSQAANDSDWGLPEATPMQQHPTGLRGGGYTPHPSGNGIRGGRLELFDGLPPSPAALAATRGHANRHVQHAGHYSSLQQQPQQSAAQPPATDQASHRRGSPAVAVLVEQQQQQQPRSPVGPDVRHTKKSAAAAAERASTASANALQRLKSRRPASAAAPAVSDAAPQSQAAPSAPSPLPAVEQQPAAVPSPAVEQLQHYADAPSPSPAAQSAVPLPPQLPPDSNAVLVAEVRELRSRLLASLQKHAPELEAAGVGLSSVTGEGPLATALKQQREQRRVQEQQQRDTSPSSSGWRLASVHAADPPPPTASCSSTFRLTDQSSLGAWPAAVVGSSSKFRLTTDDMSDIGGLGSGHQLASLGSSFGDIGGGATPGSMVRLDSLEGDSSSLARAPFSMEAFEAQTEALARRLERM